MDSLHDLGGKQGYGPVPIEAGDAPFKHDWEWRMWALNLNLRGNTGSIDWFRHGLELMVPKDYMNYAYFQKWCANILMLLIDAGYFTVDEAIEAAKDPKVTRRAGTGPSAVEILEDYRQRNTDFSVTLQTKPRFAVGDAVTTLRDGHSGHIRLPAYARSRTGTVISHHGAHVLADEGAKGAHVGDHLYTVEFTAPELWGPEANSKDTVTLELWNATLFKPDTPLAPDAKVFDEPWQAQALALADTMIKAGHFSATDWASTLGAALSAAEAAGAADTSETYYGAVITALEHLSETAGISDTDRSERRAAWEAAYLRTPHGHPVKL